MTIESETRSINIYMTIEQTSLFVENKYKQYYFSIINNAINRCNIHGYTELHHIIPRSLGGLDTKDNLVLLTAKEHFICHLLLTKCTAGKHLKSMIYAAFLMKHKHEIKLSSRLYQNLKEQYNILRIGVPRSDETKRKISLSNKGIQHNPWTLESRNHKSIALKGKPRPYLVGHKTSVSTRHKIGIASKNRSKESNRKIGEKLKAMWEKRRLLKGASLIA